jgi:hypothetical protein
MGEGGIQKRGLKLMLRRNPRPTLRGLTVGHTGQTEENPSVMQVPQFVRDDSLFLFCAGVRVRLVVVAV